MRLLSVCVFFLTYILFLWPISFGNSRLNNSSNLDLLFKVVFSLCPLSLSLLWLLCSWLMNSGVVCPDHFYCKMCETTCDLSSTSVRFALLPAVCIVQKELCMRFAFLPRAQPFISYKCPPTQLPSTCSVSAVGVCW